MPSPKAEFVVYQNINPVFGVLISNGKATLKEIQEFYSLEDVYKLFEIIKVDSYNEHKAMEKN